MKYRDKNIRLFTILFTTLFLVHIGRDGTFLEWLNNKDNYYTDLLFSFLITFLCWEATRITIIRLDKVYLWKDNFTKRVFIQLGITLFLSTIILFLFTLIYASFLGIPSHWIMAWDSEFPMALLFVLVINLIYYLLYLKIEASAKIITDTKIVSIDLVGISGKEKTKLESKDILYFYSSNKVVFVTHKNGKTYRVDYTLSELEQKLPNSFFRLNRQFIASKNAIISYKPSDNRKLTVKIVDYSSDKISVSQLKATEFKEWFKNE